MKQLTSFIFTILFISTSFAQESAFESAMQRAIASFKEAQEVSAIQAAANQFERIAQAEPDEWLAAYYAAYCYVSINFRVEGEDIRDEYLDQAQAWLAKAKNIAPKESEVFAMQAFIYTGRVSISPMMRGMTMTGDFDAAIAKATVLNPENPRIYYLDGQYTMNMPQMFGGGMKNACPILQKAKKKYEGFKSPNNIWPDWGKKDTLQLIDDCNQ